MTPVHITKRALAVVGGRPEKPRSSEYGYANACDHRFEGDYIEFDDGFELRGDKPSIETAYLKPDDVARWLDCPACLVLLDAELEGRGAEAQRQRSEIEAWR